jgi:transmembrane sensor
MPYSNYTIIDFINDDAFLRHQLAPSEASTAFWENWLQMHPHESEEWTQASKIVEAVRLGLTDYTQRYLSEEAENQLLARIQESISSHPVVIVPYWQRPWVVGLAAAAVLLLFMVFGRNLLGSTTDVFQKQLSAESNLQNEVNTTRKNKVVHLLDGSAVILSPKSKISFPFQFGTSDRKVFLEGEAVFDVAKNPMKPFFVYSSDLVVKVLGTKFVMASFQKESKVVVRVFQGQVSVYKNKEEQNQHLEGVLLQPNQQVVFQREEQLFLKSIIDNPSVVGMPKSLHPDFTFDETPVVQVFERLAKAYKIDIVYNEEMLRNCQITSSLNEESLFQKLDIITLSINATYEMVEGKIVINAKGCE